MDKKSDSSFRSGGLSASSVCPVCQGFGDLKNPRGVSVKLSEEYSRPHLPKNYYSRPGFVYIYMHYPNIWALYNSAEAGCGMCKLLHSELHAYIVRFGEATAACSPAPETTATHPLSTIYAAESDDDALIAAHLAELTRSDNLQYSPALKHVLGTRIALQHPCDKSTGPRGMSHIFNIEILAPSYNYTANVRGFNHARKSMFHDGIMTFLKRANV